MGSDKAFLPWTGRRMLDHQLDLLRALGPAELLLSGRLGIDYAAPAVRIVFDAIPDQGPLGGLAAVLEAITTPYVLLLAVDLPAITNGFLQRLLRRRAPGVGVVPRSAAGWEPLAAMYPRELLPLVRLHLEQRKLALHHLVEAGLAADLLVEAPVAPGDSDMFMNVNTPGDLPG